MTAHVAWAPPPRKLLNQLSATGTHHQLTIAQAVLEPLRGTW